MRLRRMKLKLCLVGDRAVGKTSLIQRDLQNHFDSTYRGSLGATLHPVNVEVRMDDGEIIDATVALFDLMGEHSIRETFRDAIFYGTHGVLAVCDVERPETLYALEDWIRAVSRVTGGVPFAIAFNKADRLPQLVIAPEETQWLREHFPIVPTAFTSARTGFGVEEAFRGLLDRVIDQVLEEGRGRRTKRLARHKILMFVAQRGSMGASKNDLLVAFKDLEHNELLDEVESLVRLDVLRRDDLGPGTFRVTATRRGLDIAESRLWEELVVDEPV